MIEEVQPGINDSATQVALTIRTENGPSGEFPVRRVRLLPQPPPHPVNTMRARHKLSKTWHDCNDRTGRKKEFQLP